MASKASLFNLIKLPHKRLKVRLTPHSKLNKFYKTRKNFYRFKDYFRKCRRLKYNLKKIYRTQIHSDYLSYRRYSLWRRPSLLVTNDNVNFKVKNFYVLIINNEYTPKTINYLYDLYFFKLLLINFFFNKTQGTLNYTKTRVRNFARSFRFFRYHRFVFRKKLYRRKRRKLRYKPWMRRFGRWGRRFFQFFKQRTVWQKLPQIVKKTTKQNLKLTYTKPRTFFKLYRKKVRTVWYRFSPNKINPTRYGFFFRFKQHYKRNKIRKFNYFKKFKKNYIKKIKFLRRSLFSFFINYVMITSSDRALLSRKVTHSENINSKLLFWRSTYRVKKLNKINTIRPLLTKQPGSVLNRSYKIINTLRQITSNTQNNYKITHKTLNTNQLYIFNFIYLKLLKNFLLKNTRTDRYFEPIYQIYTPTYMTNYMKIFFDMQFNSNTVLYMNFELLHRITPTDSVFLYKTKNSLLTFNYKFSTIFFLNEFLDILFLAFRLRNMDIILPYINKILKSLIIYQHKIFFDFFFKLIKGYFGPHFSLYGVAGISIKIKGKVGVGGNSRKRWIKLVTGKTTTTDFIKDTLTINKLLNTTTGALGFKMVIFYNK